MMTAEQMREYVAAVDEMRRVQMTSRRPPNGHEQKALRETEAKVDALTARYREPDPPVPSLEHLT